MRLQRQLVLRLGIEMKNARLAAIDPDNGVEMRHVSLLTVERTLLLFSHGGIDGDQQEAEACGIFQGFSEYIFEVIFHGLGCFGASRF